MPSGHAIQAMSQDVPRLIALVAAISDERAQQNYHIAPYDCLRKSRQRTHCAVYTLPSPFIDHISTTVAARLESVELISRYGLEVVRIQGAIVATRATRDRKLTVVETDALVSFIDSRVHQDVEVI